MKYLILFLYAVLVIGNLWLGVVDDSIYMQLAAIWIVVGRVLWMPED